MADYSIQCEGSERFLWLTYTMVMIFVYPIGIPTLFALLLYRKREQLGPRDDDGNMQPWKYLFVYDKAWTVATEEQRKSRLQEEDSSAAYLSFLAGAYEPRAFWFITFENVR